MTVVLAIRCKDGVVLASDSQATDLSGGHIVFATKHTVQKIFALGDHIAWGATGNAGVIQHFHHACSSIPADELAKPIEDLRMTLKGVHFNVQQHAINSTIGQFATQGAPQLGVLAAGYTAGRPWILEITPSNEDTVYDEYYAVGSGGTFAKQAMVSVAHHDVLNRSLAEAHVIAWRALDGCIEVSAYGVGKPIWIFSVTAAGVSDLAADDLKSVEDSVNTWKAAEHQALGALGLGGVAPGDDLIEAGKDGPEPEDEGLEPEAGPEAGATEPS